MNTLPSPTLPDDVIDAELQMRLGRNLLVFQRIEANLKRLMSSNRLEFHVPLETGLESIDMDSLIGKINRRAKERQEQTLGPLRHAYLAEILGIESTTNQTARNDVASFSLDVRIELPESEKAELDECFNTLVKDRNKMAHDLLPRLGKGEPENLASTRQWLDQVHQRSTRLLRILREQMHGLSAARTAAIDSLQSEDFWRLLESNAPVSH